MCMWAGRQIFSTREAFGMLSGELLHIFQRRSHIEVGTVEDSVYYWDVKLSGFEDSSLLAKVSKRARRQTRLYTQISSHKHHASRVHAAFN